MSDPLARYHEGFARLKRRFMAGLPRRMSQVDEAWERLQRRHRDRQALEDLHRELHNLIGACSTYGEEALGASVRGVEQRLRPHVDDALDPERLDWPQLGTELVAMKTQLQTRLTAFIQESEGSA